MIDVDRHGASRSVTARARAGRIAEASRVTDSMPIFTGDQSDAPGLWDAALARLHAAGARSVRAGSTGDLWPAVLDALLDVVGGDFGTLHLVAEDDARLRPAAKVRVPEPLSALADGDDETDALHQAALVRLEGIAVEDALAAGHDERLRRRVLEMNAAAMILMPLRAQDGRPAGVAGAYFQRPVRLDAERMRRAEQVLAIAQDWVELATASLALQQRVRQEREQRQVAEAASQRKDLLLATVAHELMQPLSALTPAFEAYRTTTDATRRERLGGVVVRQLRQLERLVADLGDGIHASRGTVDLRKERVDLRAVVRDAADAMQPLVEAKRHRMTLDLGDPPAWVRVDPARMTQVFSNLLRNAAEYTLPGGRIDVCLDADGERVRVRVRDSGEGIPADALERVFEIFERASTHNASTSLGVGLAIVRRVVELHGGTVSVTSVVGEGSEFVVILPRH